MDFGLLLFQYGFELALETLLIIYLVWCTYRLRTSANFGTSHPHTRAITWLTAAFVTSALIGLGALAALGDNMEEYSFELSVTSTIVYLTCIAIAARQLVKDVQQDSA